MPVPRRASSGLKAKPAGVAQAVVFNVQKFSIHDGPGIRTTVFLKGCPLGCLWCQNPEGISGRPELALVLARCTKCNKCLTACPEGAISLDAGGAVVIDRDRCTACGKCVEVCYPEALMMFGKKMSADEVFKEVDRDRAYYEDSGGGVTVSGGEPLAHPAFVTALFRLCHEVGTQTCIETTGYSSTRTLGRVLEVTDYVLYDLKHMDSETHRKLTGKRNELVLENARFVGMTSVPMLCRIPLIPGMNDSLENLAESARFVKTLRKDMAIELVPYHRMGMWKYQALAKPYANALEGVKSPEPEELERLRQHVENQGVQCMISK